ncbi:MAG TPA: DUF6130 family protein [Schlesneria sp.]|jgi:hypothetical protein
MSAFPLTRSLRGMSIALAIAGALSNALLIAGEKAPTEANTSEQSSKGSDSKATLTAKDLRGATAMIPVAEESPAKLILDPPLPQLLARGMALIQFRTENARVVPVYGTDATKVSPRIGHLHIRLDDNPWVWAHTSGDDLIVNRLTAGKHKIQVDLVSANHKILAKGVVQFEVPDGPHMQPLPGEHDLVSDQNSKGEPSAKIFVDPPLADLLPDGIAFIKCRTENAQVIQVFGVAALDVSPRICHVHITVDDARWRWADTTGGPVILKGLPPGPHKVLIELVNANHKPIAGRTVQFEVPQRPSDTKVTQDSEPQDK